MKPQLSFFNFAINSKESNEVDVHIDGDIVDSPTQELLREFWNDETSVSFRSFRNNVEKASPRIVNVYVNSGGGHVGDAMAIHDYLADLENKGVTVNRIGRGIIASAATYIVMGNNSEMSENSFFMIHNVSMVAYGDINQVENQVKAGRAFNNRIRDFYAEQTGNPPETISSWMNKETWMTAQEAKDRGFVKNVSGKSNFTNSIPAEKWPFTNTAILNSYNSFTQNNNDMDTSKITAALKNVLLELGLAKDENDAKLNTAVEKITNALTSTLSVDNAAIEQTITDTVTNMLKDISKESVQAMVNSAVAESTKGFVKEDDFKNFKTSVADKMGAPADEPKETPAERKVNNKRSFFQVGSFEKN